MEKAESQGPHQEGATMLKERTILEFWATWAVQEKSSPQYCFEQVIILTMSFVSSLHDPEPILNKAVLRLVWIPVHSALWDP